MTLIHYYGHSCFALTAGNGWRCVFDPYQDNSVPGLKLIPLEAQEVYCSHDHADHNASENVSLKQGAMNPYRVTELLADHDDQGGALRGKNRITLLENDDEKIVHLGDLGRSLTAEETEMLKNPTVLMIPCGGFYTIDGAMAKEIIHQLNPALTILMHYRTDEHGYDEIASLDQVIQFIGECMITETCEIDSAVRTGIVALCADPSVLIH